MRIALCGAAGTGKTTLATMISKELGIPINPVGSRSVAKDMGFDSPYDVDKAGQRAAFQRRLLTEKLAWEAEHDSFVTDRTTMDNLAYTIMHDVDAIDEETLQQSITGMRRYTSVFFCSMSSFWEIAGDPQRRGGKVYQAMYEVVLSGLLGQCAAAAALQLRTRSVPAGSAESRYLFVKSKVVEPLCPYCDQPLQPDAILFAGGHASCVTSFPFLRGMK